MNETSRQPDNWERDRVAWNLPRPNGSKPVHCQSESATKPAGDATPKVREKR